MSIFLEGSFSCANNTHLWRGVWQFCKEPKVGFPFAYQVLFTKLQQPCVFLEAILLSPQRISEVIPHDLLDYVSFSISSSQSGLGGTGSDFTNAPENAGFGDQKDTLQAAICSNSHPLFGLWTGSFDVANRTPGEPVSKVEETFFLCGVSGEKLLGEGLNDLPPEPTVRYA